MHRKNAFVNYIRSQRLQSFQDCYEKCVPKLKNLQELDHGYRNRKQVSEECKILYQERKQYQKMQIEDKLAQQNTDTNNFRDQKQKYCRNIAFVQKQKQDNNKQNFEVKSSKQVNATNASATLCAHSLSPSVVPSQELQPVAEQSTTSSLKLPSLSTLPRRLLPNFSTMSRHDYQLFHIYFHKINRQNQRYEKLHLQFENFREVYKVIQQENQQYRNKYQQIFIKGRELLPQIQEDFEEGNREHRLGICQGNVGQFNFKQQQSQLPDNFEKSIDDQYILGKHEHYNSKFFQLNQEQNMLTIVEDIPPPEIKRQDGQENNFIQFHQTEKSFGQPILIHQLTQIQQMCCHQQNVQLQEIKNNPI